MKNTRPNTTDYNAYYETYVGKVQSEDIVATLSNSFLETMQFLKAIPTEKWDYAYAEDKWTVKKLILHVIDTERVFSYRALCIARNEKTPLPGFDQDEYASFMNANNRTIESLIEAYECVRKASLILFENFTDEMWQRRGIASDDAVTPLALAYIVQGHENHHFLVLKERYLK